MIAAGFLPECPAAWHRGVYALVSLGWWPDIPAIGLLPPLVWMALPAAVVTVAAVVTAAWSKPRAIALVVGLSTFVHPWLPVALVPLVAAATPWRGWRPWRLPLAVAAALTAAAVLLTPACGEAGPAVAWTDLVRPILGGLGLAGAALVALDLAFVRRRPAQAATLAVAIVSLGLAVSGWMDGATAAGAALAAFWVRAAAGGLQVLRWQTTTASRLGAGLLLVLVPILAAAPVIRVSRTAEDPATGEVWHALDALEMPAAIAMTGGRADVAVVIWQAGRHARAGAVSLITPPDADSGVPVGRAVYAWRQTAVGMRRRGFIMGALAKGDGAAALSRVLDEVPCAMLTTDWIDIHEQASSGQLTGVFSRVAPLRGALLYVASATPLAPRSVGWPPEAAAGFEARFFDRQSPDGTAALAEATSRDALDPAVFGQARYVVRVRADRRATAPEALAIALGGVPDVARARRYAADDELEERLPAMCRDTSGMVVTSFEGAAPVADLDITSPQVAGRGWLAFESAGDDRARWTSSDADLFFIAGEARPLRLEIEADPATGDWASAAMRVRLNGFDAGCLEGVPPCDWLLGAEEMRRGLNVVTLHAEAGPAEAGEAPRGLLVRRARLVALRVAR
ncbi:MAG: hypothetical protein IT180_12755 [Acidobacteria bacterium]|nr:hypothetical protein [Acidobacteriota bacterium]